MRSTDVVAIVALLALAGCIDTVAESEAPCPCAPGYVCDTTINRCFLESLRDGGTPRDGGITRDGGLPRDAGPRDGGGQTCTDVPSLCDPGQACIDEQCLRYVDVATDFDVTCAVRASGRVACWGSCIDRRRPTWVADIDDAIELDIAGIEYCALRDEGRVSCWPITPQTPACAAPPGVMRAVEVPLSGPAVAIAKASVHACAFLSDDTVECWGDNSDGQFGAATPAGIFASPVAVALSVRDVVLADANRRTTCVAHGPNADQLSCWGRVSGEQLGPIQVPAPIEELLVSSSGNEVDIRTADRRFTYDLVQEALDEERGTPPLLDIDRSCLVDADGMLFCRHTQLSSANFWGYVPEDASGYVIGSTVAAPVWRSAIGIWHGCFLDQAGEVYCYGDDGFVGTRTHRVPSDFEPALLDRRVVPRVPPGSRIALGAETAAAITPSRALYTWGLSNLDVSTSVTVRVALRGGPYPVDLFGHTPLDVKLYGPGATSTMALLVETSTGTRRVWAFGARIPMGSEPRADFFRPYVVPALDGAIFIDAANDEICARLPDGRVRCISRTNDVFVPELAGASDLALEFEDDWRMGIVGGEVRCVPALGACPTMTATVTDAVEIDAGRDFAIIRRANGTAVLVSDDPRIDEPEDLFDLTSVTATDQHVCATKEDGRTYCWGRNDTGAVDPGSPGTWVSVAASFPLTGRFDQVEAGGNFTCGVRAEDGAIECWGTNDDCQLGSCPGVVYEQPVRIAEPVP